MKRSFQVLVGAIPIVFASVAMSADKSDLRADQPVISVGPEWAVNGITIEERSARQAELHGWLSAVMPDGVRGKVVSVELTVEDRADVDAPYVSGTPLKIGVVKPIMPAVEVLRGQGFKRGAVEETADGGYTWATTISSPDANAIRVHFRGFSLPDGAEMYIMNDLGEAHGPYTGVGRNGDGDFWTHSVSSESAVLLLTHPGPDTGKVRFVIDRVGHIRGRTPVAVQQSWSSNKCDNPDCVLDANCGSVGPASQSAIAKYEWISGCCIYTCTGGLIADTDNSSQRNLFLTANHCISRQRLARNLETFFNYTTSSCNGDCPPWPSTPDTIGATILDSSSDGDHTLMELNENPPGGTSFLGWSNAPIANSNGANLYRVSNPNYGPQVYSHHQVDTGAGTCSGLPRGEIIYSNDVEGATDGGSSGSPVVNSSGQIVGQLYGCCGFNCGDPCDSGSNSTVDGALAHYYPSVAEFLDPGTGCTPSTEICDNGSDDDCDNDVDCDDADCVDDPACQGGGCTAGQLGDPCVDNADCCSNKCKGRSGRKTCK